MVHDLTEGRPALRRIIFSKVMLATDHKQTQILEGAVHILMERHKKGEDILLKGNVLDF